MYSFLPKKNMFFITKDELETIGEFNKKDNQDLITVKENDIIGIEIEKCSFSDFLKYGDMIDKYNICLRNFIYDGPLSQDTILENQKIYIIENNNKKYLITLNEKKAIISEYQTTDENIYEIQLKLDLNQKEFKISKYIHNLTYSTIETKFYPIKKDKFKQCFVLEKVEAYSLVNSLLSNLSKIKDINNIIDLCEVYHILNLMPNDYYTPVISDENISLSWIYSEKDKDLNKQNYVFFDIFLNDTKEVVGNISFDYNNGGFSYCGNVSYAIKEQYKGNHYATTALKLMKELLKNNEYDGDKDLYVSTIPTNIKSQRVIENNNGYLIYEGSVPEDESIFFIDGIKEVKVYRININKKS